MPSLDISPANGIPDFVENVALYFDKSWAVAVDSLGFGTPAGAVYQVSFESMQYYGYTTVVSAATGETRIVMHNTYVGFPENEDPEGVVAGAAKVTAAHEFKHATQYATSRWSEGGWVELDATWFEDVVYDQVNDYYNYLNGESPLRQPAIPLDGGANTTGSYEDCVWQTYLAETRGVGIIQDFWTRRALLPSEAVMETYRAVLTARGSSLAVAWASFAAWNYGAGGRAVTGVGYEEAAGYPLGPVLDTATMYPFTVSGSVEHLAAEFVRLEGFSALDMQMLRVQFDGQDAVGPLTLAIHVARRDGTGLIETITLDGSNDADHLVSVPVRDMLSAGIVVGNAAVFGLTGTWDLDLSLVPIPAVPVAEVDRSAVSVVLMADTADQELVRLTNAGEEGSLLPYQAQLWTTSPDKGESVPDQDKSVAGSTFTSVTTSYLPGQLMNLDFAVFNGSADQEWLTDLSLDFPAGVTVLVASDFVGGSLGDLVADNSLGDGAQVTWHGTYGLQDYGVVRDGESAFATVQVMVGPGFSGDLALDWTLTGDDFGTTPHQIAGTLVLAEGSPVLTLQSTNGGEILRVDEPVTVLWSTGGVVPLVDLDLSRDGGLTWAPVAAGLANDGTEGVVLGGPPANTCLLRVRDSGGGIADVSDEVFQLYASPTWADVAPVAGVLAAGEGVDLMVIIDAAGMIPGNHEAWLVVLHGGVSSRTVVPILLQVEPGTSAVAPVPAFALHGAYPNPFNPQTSILFELPVAAATTVDILDVRGHRVRQLFQGALPAGNHSQVWDGRDGAGHGVGAGVYLVRVRSGRHDATTKVLLAK